MGFDMVWMGPENLTPTQIRTPDHPATNESTDFAIPSALNAVEETEISCPSRALNHDSSDIYFVLHYTVLAPIHTQLQY